MEQRPHFLTLATPDLDAARKFYRDGLGWTPLTGVPDEILFFQVAPGVTLNPGWRTNDDESVQLG